MFFCPQGLSEDLSLRYTRSDHDRRKIWKSWKNFNWLVCVVDQLLVVTRIIIIVIIIVIINILILIISRHYYYYYYDYLEGYSELGW